MASTPDVLAASGKSGIKSYADMKELVKDSPDKAAVAACDANDGLKDGLISAAYQAPGAVRVPIMMPPPITPI